MRYIILREIVYWPVTRDGNAHSSVVAVQTHVYTRTHTRTRNTSTCTRKLVEKKLQQYVYARNIIYLKTRIRIYLVFIYYKPIWCVLYIFIYFKRVYIYIYIYIMCRMHNNNSHATYIRDSIKYLLPRLVKHVQYTYVYMYTHAYNIYIYI